MSTGETTGSFEYRSDIDESLGLIEAILAVDLEGNVVNASPVHAQRLREVAKSCIGLAETIETQAAAQMAEDMKNVTATEPELIASELWKIFDDYYFSYSDELPVVETAEQLRTLELYIESHTGKVTTAVQVRRMRDLRALLIRASGGLYQK